MSLHSYNFSVTWYHFRQKAYIKHARIIMKCLVSSFTDTCISAFPSFYDIEYEIIQSLFWASQYKTDMGILG